MTRDEHHREEEKTRKHAAQHWLHLGLSAWGTAIIQRAPPITHQTSQGTGEHFGESVTNSASAANLSHQKGSHRSHQHLPNGVCLKPSFRVVRTNGPERCGGQGDGNDGVPLRNQTLATPIAKFATLVALMITVRCRW